MIVPDIYFEKNYGEIYEKIENGKNEIFISIHDEQIMYYQFIKRKIEIVIEGKEYYDITTPYGYGGPVFLGDSVPSDKLIDEFNEKFENYCNENNIVSEFIRFHPIMKNNAYMKKIYDIEFDRNTIGINLYEYGKPFEGEFSSKCKNTIRKSIKKDICIDFDFECNTLKEFCDIYELTMKRNNASNYYYFGYDFFIKFIKKLQGKVFIVNAKLNNMIISSSMFMLSDNYIHYHFSGTKNEYFTYAPVNLIISTVADWGYENGYKILHLGGGVTNDKNDSLYAFKKSFSKHTKYDFHIAKKIWNRKIYDALCKKMITNMTKYNYFPLYRLNN